MLAGLPVSFIVPTRNRSAAVGRLLRRLAEHHADSPPFEAVVVDDGSTDGTTEILSHTQWPFRFRLVQQHNAGAAVARNAGARAASGEVLLFLDDDVEPEPGLVAAHAGVHDGREDIVGLGDLPPLVSHATLFGVMLGSWWGAMQDPIRRPGHRYSYRDMLSGHFSIRRARFEGLGGFDERLRCREDYELGYRALMAGLQLQFVPQAVAWHHDSTDPARAIRRKFDEGLADVQLLQRHPALATTLPLGRGPAHKGLQRRMMRLAWRNHRTGEHVARTLMATMPSLERVRLRRRWRSVLNGLLTYWYWRGVALAVGTPANLDALLATAPAVSEPVVTLDLADGLEAAAGRLDRLAPRAARLVVAGELVGDVPDLPGAEPIQGRHLRPLLATSFRLPYLRALATAGVVPAALATPAARLAAHHPGGGTRDVAAA